MPKKDCGCEFGMPCRIECFEAANREQSQRQMALRKKPYARFKPMASEALGVHPDQIPEAREHAAKSGVPVDFDRTGRPILTSARQFKRYAKARGLIHKGYA